MSPFEFTLVTTIAQARRDLAGVDAPAWAILARLPVCVPERTLRYYLRRLESQGYVHRPRGPKSGWGLTKPVELGLRAGRISYS